MALISTFANGSKPSFCIKDTHLKGIDLDDVWYVRVVQAPTTDAPNAAIIVELLNDEGAPFMQEDESFENGAPYEDEEYGTGEVLTGRFNLTHLDADILTLAYNHNLTFSDVHLSKCETREGEVSVTLGDMGSM